MTRYDDAETEGITERTEYDYQQEVEEEELETSLLSCSVWDDICTALYETRFTAPLFALLGVFLAYHVTIAPYRVDVADIGSKTTCF